MFDINSEQDARDKQAGRPVAGGKLGMQEEAFKKRLLQLVEDGEIQLHKPETLFRLPESERAERAMIKAIAILAKIRTLVDLYNHPEDTLLHEQTILQALRHDIESFESKDGNIFKL